MIPRVLDISHVYVPASSHVVSTMMSSWLSAVKKWRGVSCRGWASFSHCSLGRGLPEAMHSSTDVSPTRVVFSSSIGRMKSGVSVRRRETIMIIPLVVAGICADSAAFLYWHRTTYNLMLRPRICRHSYSHRDLNLLNEAEVSQTKQTTPPTHTHPPHNWKNIHLLQQHLPSSWKSQCALQNI